MTDITMFRGQLSSRCPDLAFPNSGKTGSSFWGLLPVFAEHVFQQVKSLLSVVYRTYNSLSSLVFRTHDHRVPTRLSNLIHHNALYEPSENQNLSLCCSLYFYAFVQLRNLLHDLLYSSESHPSFQFSFRCYLACDALCPSWLIMTFLIHLEIVT